jgi:Putative peptidoglycan binding domain
MVKREGNRYHKVFLSIFWMIFYCVCFIPQYAFAGEKYHNDLILEIQYGLSEKGYDSGPHDGLWGPLTSNAIKEFQRDHGLPITGKLDYDTQFAITDYPGFWFCKMILRTRVEFKHLQRQLYKTINSPQNKIELKIVKYIEEMETASIQQKWMILDKIKKFIKGDALIIAEQDKNSEGIKIYLSILQKELDDIQKPLQSFTDCENKLHNIIIGLAGYREGTILPTPSVFSITLLEYLCSGIGFTVETQMKGRWEFILCSKNGDTVCVVDKKSNKKLFQYYSASITHAFIEADIIFFKDYKRPFFLSKWTSGAHGEEILIFDMEKERKKAVFYYASSWPMSWEVKDGVLVIHGTGSFNEKTEEPEVEIIKWHPDMNK